ncbi:MAG TPA: glycosyltransferase family 4 protein [Kineosporiaceae bacterium]|nr:glycosyltransferase family 4 protein [Kineosporiaceae bacterium]
MSHIVLWRGVTAGMAGRGPGSVRLCVVRQHYVPQDTRVLREVEALADAGYEVDVLCVRRPGEPARERRGRIRIRRLVVPDRGGGLARYLLRYPWFFAQAAVLLGVWHLRRRYRVVQVNSLPDALIFAAAVPRLLGARVLLDLQECMPEFFATKFGTSTAHPAVRVLIRLEQASIRFAHAVVTPTAQLRALFVARGAAPSKITVVMDGADEDVFRRQPDARPDPGHFTLISHGTIEERYGLDTAVEAVAAVRAEIPGVRLKIYGDGSDKARLARLAVARGVVDRVWFSEGFVPFAELTHALSTADVGVVAMKRDAFRDVTLPGKLFDFVAMGLPSAVSRTRSITQTFDQDCFEYFESGNADDLARALRRLHADAGRRARLAEHARRAAEPYRWPRQRETYLAVVDGLLNTRRKP